MAPALKVDVVPVNMREAADLERAVAAFARSPNGGLILTGSGLSILHRDLIITLAARHKLPAIYYERFFVSAGGLISYGSDRIELYRLRPATLIAFSGGKAGRSSGAGAYQIRIGHQSQDSEGAWSNCTVHASCDRHRDNSIDVAMSAIGTKRTSLVHCTCPLSE